MEPFPQIIRIMACPVMPPPPHNRQMAGSVIMQDGGMSLLPPKAGGDRSLAEKFADKLSTLGL